MWIKSIHKLAEAILSTVPKVFSPADAAAPQQRKRGCWADAHRLLWPLLAVSWTTYGLREHRDQARRVLRRLGQEMGIELALRCRPPAGRFSESEDIE